jgi:apolipoprotein N-acyltransferase
LGKYFFIGWALAFLFWAYSLAWLFDAVNYYGAGNLLSAFITILLVAYLSIYFGIFFFAIKFFQKSKYRYLILPSVFFLLEWMKSWIISGFPWLNLGAINEFLWGALPIIGASGTSFLIILVITLFFEKNHIFIARTAASILVALMIFGPGHYQKGGQEQLEISVIQPLNTDLKEII